MRSIHARGRRVPPLPYVCGKTRQRAYVYRDVACRYIQMFGGTTITADNDVGNCEIYLRNVHFSVIAKVSPFDKYPKLAPDPLGADMPL